MSEAQISGYDHYAGDHDPSHDRLWPAVTSLLRGPPGPLFDLGCGDGGMAARLAAAGWMVTGVDPSEAGVAAARSRYPHLALHAGSAYDDLAAQYGTFPQVISLEVVEHVYAPRAWARTLFELVAPGGRAVVSTPYHGYVKNLAIALTGGFDRHFTALWDHGHIKFWSRATLASLLAEAGFVVTDFKRVGRLAPIAKSMLLAADRPG